jgi:Fic family protein
MKRRTQGSYKAISTAGEIAKAFVPAPLPPKPAIDWTPELRRQFDIALHSLGRLDSMSSLIPDTSLFLYMYVRKEAVLSSMIEGTQSSLSDLLLYELKQEPGVPHGDAEEVSNYVAALYYGLKKMRSGFPLSLRLLKEIHGVLLSGGRGSDKAPGEFRRSQNWIGGTRPGNAIFVPPPPEDVEECMSRLELFLHDQPVSTTPLVKAALAHVQFETIHPFLDGNGRLGRLLIALLLCEAKVISEPVLYLSLHFKNHRKYYYELLNEVRETGNWEAWLAFFADAVLTTANQAWDATRKLVHLVDLDRKKISKAGRAKDSMLKVHQLLLRMPIATPMWLVEHTKLTPATVNKTLDHLTDLKIVKELTAQKRNRVFAYSKYIDVLNAGIDA